MDPPEAYSPPKEEEVFIQFVDISQQEDEPTGQEIYCTSELSSQESSQNIESDLNMQVIRRTYSRTQFNESHVTSSIPEIFCSQNEQSKIQTLVYEETDSDLIDTVVVQSNPDSDCEEAEDIQHSPKNDDLNDKTTPELSEVIFDSEAADSNDMQQVTFTTTSEVSKNANVQNMEDYIDVVTTYQCKFCRFSCQWKSGLMSHIRNCHFSNSRATSSKNVAFLEPESESQSSSYEDSYVALGTSENANANTEELAEEEAITPVVHDLVDTAGRANEEFERHIYLCGECSRGFDTLNQCKAHMVKNHNVNPYEPLSKGKKHSKNKAAKKPSKSWHTVQASDEEKNEDDPEPSPNVGKSTDEASVSNKRMMKHAKSLEESDFLFETKKRKERKDSLGERAFRCGEPGCNCRFCNEANLDYHRQCHLSKDSNPFGCPECAEKFEQWRHLLMHLWKEHLVDLDLYTCLQCGYKSFSQFKLNIHQKIHGEARDFMCHTCGKSFKQHSQLRNHRVIHMDREERCTGQKRWYSMQECDICQRTFSDSKSLSKHKQAVHAKIKPYVCSFCGHTSARKAMLQLHMRQHTGEKPFSCEHCDYRTGDHNSLRRHRMRHTGSKPYKCSHCSYACIQAISLKTHLKNKHPGLDGLYACSLCGFRSVSREKLMNHMADHSRGAIPVSAKPKSPEMVDEAPQLHLPEDSTQLEEMSLPKNMISAQLICSCLNAITQDGETIDLPPGVLTSSSDGTQTITIQIPANANEETGEQYYFTIQQAVASNNLDSQDTELDLLDNVELKLGDNEQMSVSDYITSDPVSCLLQEGEC